MNRFLPLLPLAASLLLVGCGSDAGGADPGAAPAARAMPVADGDACVRWIADVKALCADHVEGRAVTADCGRQSINLRTSLEFLADPRIAGSICSKHAEGLRAERAAAVVSPAVAYGPQCSELAAAVRAECVDTLAEPGDWQHCNVQLVQIATARGAEDPEFACAMALHLRAAR
jgi:hypothetical protein